MQANATDVLRRNASSTIIQRPPGAEGNACGREWELIAMRDKIIKRLAEYRTEALERIAIAESNTIRDAAKTGNINSGRMYLIINEDNKTGFAEYLDRSVKFIRHVAGSSASQYADELRNAGHTLNEAIIARMAGNQLRNDLETALDKLIRRKLEDFEFGYAEGQDMNSTTQNTVNIINSNISNAVIQITQSGKDAISKETAQKLQEIINSDEIKGLPEETRLNVLDHAEAVINELNATTTDKGKVHRGLKRLGTFIKDVASDTIAKIAAELAVAYARANGLM
jgi:hypothetical protein